MRTFLVAILLFAALSANAQQVAPAPKFIRENSPVIALTHVQLIDGTDAAAQADQTIVIDHGKIAAVGSAASTNVPAGAKAIDARGKTVIPGLVGMHEHLFYPATNDGEPIFIEQPFSFPQLYLASGVTLARTTGSIEPYTDLPSEGARGRRPIARAGSLSHHALPRRRALSFPAIASA
jgi:hypothetical protein